MKTSILNAHNVSVEDVLQTLEKILPKKTFHELEDALEGLAISRKDFQNNIEISRQSERISHAEIKKLVA